MTIHGWEPSLNQLVSADVILMDNIHNAAQITWPQAQVIECQSHVTPTWCVTFQSMRLIHCVNGNRRSKHVEYKICAT